MDDQFPPETVIIVERFAELLSSHDADCLIEIPHLARVEIGGVSSILRSGGTRNTYAYSLGHREPALHWRQDIGPRPLDCPWHMTREKSAGAKSIVRVRS